jgi:hypothetical protein
MNFSIRPLTNLEVLGIFYFWAFVFMLAVPALFYLIQKFVIFVKHQIKVFKTKHSIIKR